MSVRTLWTPAGMVHLGHIDRAYDSRDFMWEDVRPALQKAGLLPNVPKGGGHGNDISEWPMGANGPDPSAPGLAGSQGCGDCEIAGKQNEIIEACLDSNRAMPTLDGSTAVPVYTTLTALLNNGVGYNPADGSGDTGLDTRTVLNYFQKTGITDRAGKTHKIGPYFFGEPGNWQTYWEMAYFFEAAGIAWDFTTAMMDQFNANKPFSYVRGAQSEGGHYTAGMGPNRTICWTRNTPFTTGCYTHQNTEVSAFVTAERYNRVTGETLEHYKDVDLEKFAVLLAQGGVTPAS